MNLIRGLNKLELSEKEKSAIEQGAYLYAKHAQLYFKILSIEGENVTIVARQLKNSDNQYFTPKELILRGKELFKVVDTEKRLHIHPQPYRKPIVDKVTPDWLQENFSKKKISSKRIRELTGIDKGNISKWISGKKRMSQPTKAMFLFLIENWEKYEKHE